MLSDEAIMHRCFDLAMNGLGHVSPNPMVGCVITCRDRIIGEGYHQEYGKAHAEVNAIASVKNKETLRESSLYVNLEPCAHQGKTPPCAELIIKHQIPRVVISNRDPYPEVAGKGIEQLKNAGVEVITGICSEEGRELNKRFFTFHEKKRPYTILKWAQTIDGFMDIDRNDPAIAFQWISNDNLKLFVHKWRSEEDGIIVGYTTAMNDDPQLNVREWQGRNPLRMVLDENLRLPPTLKVFDGSTPTLVFTSLKKPDQPNLEYITLDFRGNILAQMNRVLFERGIQSLMVEGGRELLDTYLEFGSWDEARVLEGNRCFGRGLKAPDFRGSLVSSGLVGADRLLIFRKP
ncbi:MAG TPA: bifunctional diaminohydroxyphosphoribosylaminopyrimidine deaminase/5-amino-6-(5-phosphoribosylamino)uracil reductase RibD [Bacteroidales bacterium]|nr:bifunctional diaminohydroxyphosphoribosylaminopyrimidine deaminase/5-amino-6-(5-phosphoribosylamino)uracil reductase RibD [Bacteroidales bacterium]HSA42401.1 bifunctional diaminohydroxyphosphoribosylaminopyrimidine deaminase/5-amino-6-(5-phosphoribosylamino)uracil reductase RibD [Bacteroidales bacterium]